MLRTPKRYYLVIFAVAVAVSGCSAPGIPPGDGGLAGQGETHYQDLGFDGETWPRLEGVTLTILAYQSFQGAFGDLEPAFENLTGANVVLVVEDDAGQVLQRAVQERGDPSFDVIYGIDNLLLGQAIDADIFEVYDPLNGERINASVPRAPDDLATPISQGFHALNVDPRNGLNITNLDQVRDHAEELVVADPRTSTPGLGFLLATVATYGEPGGTSIGTPSPGNYDYLDYWEGLLEGGAMVAADWTVAYETHFTGGYGQFSEGADPEREIVTSYTTSPAYEMYWEYDTLNGVVTAPKSTFHQVQYMGIARGTHERAAAEAWIEFALTDDLQGLLASGEAIYPVVDGVSVQDVYQGRDPAPGTFEPAVFGFQEIHDNVERWLSAWTDVYERVTA